MGVSELVFEWLVVWTKIKGVFSRSYCYFGNLLCQENDNNDTTIVASTDRLVIMTQQNLVLENAGNCCQPP